MFKVILSAVFALGLSSVAFADDAAPGHDNSMEKTQEHSEKSKVDPSTGEKKMKKETKTTVKKKEKAHGE